MTSAWKPEQYTYQYHEALEKMIEGKIEHGDEPPAPAKKKNEKRSGKDIVAGRRFHLSCLTPSIVVNISSRIQEVP
jgi:non-homologous end joining protein Ku